MNRKGEQFLQQHPTAVKVYMNGPRNRLFGTIGSVLRVNGEKPAMFVDGTRDGFFIFPGENQVEMSFQKDTFFGLFVRHSFTDCLCYTLSAETEKSYSISYSFKTQELTFRENQPKK